MIRFEDIEIMPGVVIKNDDPKLLGRVKVSVPLWFNQKTMHINAINWVYPMVMHRYQSFSKMELGRTVWVLHEKNNYYDYQYIPMFEINDDLKQLLERSYNNTEVIFTRQKGDVTAQMFYNDDDGIIARYGDASITIDSENNIIATDKVAKVSIENSLVYLGQFETEKNNAVMGNRLYDALYYLGNELMNTADLLKKDPQAVQAAEYLRAIAQEFTYEKIKPEWILSDSVFVYGR